MLETLKQLKFTDTFVNTSKAQFSVSMVSRWVRSFNEGHEHIHDEERSGRQSLIYDDLLKEIGEKIKKQTVLGNNFWYMTE